MTQLLSPENMKINIEYYAAIQQTDEMASSNIIIPFL